ncbi:hypothetical protein Leryth_009025 [Lithospermum erythrorhizon]|nr:hypothetical protein Leryth_009025 [Lithospermum erythrorhizon]
MLAIYLKGLMKPSLTRHICACPQNVLHKNPIFLGLLHKNGMFLGFFSSEANDVDSSFTVRYLIHKCGLSSESALRASKTVQLMSPRQPDSILSLLKNQGFSKGQITQLISRRPDILNANPVKTILPKFKFFLSIGIPASALASGLSSYPDLFRRGISKSLIPCYNYVKGFVDTDARVVYVFKQSVRLFVDGWKRQVPQNVATLRDYGVPEKYICFMFSYHPTALMQFNDQFVKRINKVIEMGFDSSKLVFVVALQLICNLKQSTLDRKRKVYSKWGWSESDMDTAFRVHPICMSLSETKIDSAMDFFVNKMGCQSRAIAKSPMLLFFNLENRIVPRCLVAKALLLKGLRKKGTTHISGFLIFSNDRFMQYYVTKYLKEFPQLLDLYKGKITINDLGFSAEEKL